MANLCLFNLMLKQGHDTYSTVLYLLVPYQTSYYPSLHHSRYLVSYQTNLCSRWELRRATETVWHLPRRPLHYESPWSCYSFQATVHHLSASQPSEKRSQLKIYLSTIWMQSLVTISHKLKASFKYWMKLCFGKMEPTSSASLPFSFLKAYLRSFCYRSLRFYGIDDDPPPPISSISTAGPDEATTAPAVLPSLVALDPLFYI